MALTAAQFLALGAPRRETVQFEGASILIRELTVAERAPVLKCWRENPAALPALVIRFAVIDEDGNPIFSESEAEQLMSQRPALIDTVARAIMQLSKLSGESAEKKV